MAILSTIRIAVDGAQARRELNRFESGFARVAGSIRKMTAAIGIGGTVGIIAGLQAAIRRAVSESSSIEILEVAFTNLSGSAEQAQRILRTLEEQAGKTGVSVADQADAVRKFLALGFDPDRALKLQKSILDVAGSMGLTSFQAGQLGFAISQVAAKGCHGIDTPIRLHDGSEKVVQDIEVGDLLMGPDGGHRQVLVLARGRQEMFKITPSRGEPFIVNLDHKMRVWRDEKKITLTVRDYLSEPDNVSLEHSKLGRIDFEIKSIGEGDFYGFNISGDHLYLDAQGFEHHNTVSMEELRQQIAEKGVPVFDALAQKIGVSTGEVIKLVSQGKIASDTLLGIFENYEGPFAKFEGGAEKLGATLSGVFNRIRANLVLVFRAIGDPIRDTLKQSLGPLIDDVKNLTGTARLFGQELSSAFRGLLSGDLSGAINDFIQDAPARIKDFGSVLRDVGSVAKSLASVFIGVGGAVAENIKAIAALTTAYVGLKAASATVGVFSIFRGAIEQAKEATGTVLESLRIQKTAARKTAKEVVAAEKAVTAAKMTTAAANKEVTKSATIRGSVERGQAAKVVAAEERVSAAKAKSIAASKSIGAAEDSLAIQRGVAAKKAQEAIAGGEVRLGKVRAQVQERVAAAEQKVQAARVLAAKKVESAIIAGDARIAKATEAVGASRVRLQIAEENLNQARISGYGDVNAALRSQSVARNDLARREKALAGVQKSATAERVATETAATRQIALAEGNLNKVKLKGASSIDRAQKQITASRVAAENAAAISIARAEERVQLAKLNSKLAEEALTRASEIRAAAATASSAAITKAIERENAARALALGAIRAQRDAEIASNAARLAATQSGAISAPVIFVGAGKKSAGAFSKGFSTVTSALGAAGRGAGKAFGTAFRFIAGGALLNFIGFATTLFIGWEIAKIIEDKLKITDKIKDSWDYLFNLQNAIDRAAENTAGNLITQLSTSKTLAELTIARALIEKKIEELSKEQKELKGEELNIVKAEIAALQQALTKKTEITDETKKEADELAKLRGEYDKILARQIEIKKAAEEAREAGKQEAINESLKGQEKINALKKEEADINQKLGRREAQEIALKDLQAGINQFTQAIKEGNAFAGEAFDFNGQTLTLKEAEEAAKSLTDQLSNNEGLEERNKLLERLKEVTKELTEFEMAAATPDDKRLAIAEAIKDANEEAYLNQLSNEALLAELAQQRLEIEEKINKARTKKEVLDLQKDLQDNQAKTLDLALQGITKQRDKEINAETEVFNKRIAFLQAERGASGERERLERIGVRFGGERGAALPSFVRRDLEEANIQSQIDALQSQTREIIRTKNEISSLPKEIWQKYRQEFGTTTSSRSCPVGSGSPFGE